MNAEQINRQLFEACLEALALFDNYPQCYESIGTYQVLNIAVNNVLKAQEVVQS
jgi:hypothetical protein